MSGVREHILELINIVEQLKGMDMTISKSFLVQFILNSFPPQFGPFKINYNTQKDKWNVSQLISMCHEEEERLKREGLQTQTVHVVSQGHRPKKHKRKNPKAPNKEASNYKGFGWQCHFCKKKGHMQKDCVKCKAWFQKKGNFFSFVCFETNLVNVDSGATIHISNNM